MPLRLLDRFRLATNNLSMSKSLVQPLIVACAFALTLPSGWCCLLPLQTAQAAAVQEDAPCCCRDTSESARPACCSGESSHPEPSIPIVKACCCSTPLSLPPANVAPNQPEATALLVFSDGASSTATAIADQKLDDFSPLSCSLHLFQCVWRC